VADQALRIYTERRACRIHAQSPDHLQLAVCPFDSQPLDLQLRCTNCSWSPGGAITEPSWRCVEYVPGFQ